MSAQLKAGEDKSSAKKVALPQCPNPTERIARAVRIGPLAAPILALAFSFGLAWWTFPEGMSFWRGVAITAAWGGSGMLVASLLFIIREPPLAVLLGGLDTMYRWHHRSGVLAYTVLLCHPLALAMAAWSESPGMAWQVLSPWVQHWPVRLGWLALVLLMLGLATTFAMRLPYRQWRACHYALGLAIAVALIHVYAFVGASGALLLLVALAAAALGWRLLRSDLGVAAHQYRVTHVIRPSAEMIEATLAPCAGRVAISPGQFVLAAFGEGPRYQGCDEFHPFTVSAIHADGALSVGIKALGPCTRRIQTLEPGVLVRLQGPFGNFLQPGADGPQLWVAGGIGITPFLAALRRGAVPRPTTLVYLFRTEQDAAFLEELRAFAASHPEFELITAASGEGMPDVDALLARVKALAQQQVRICGPAAMTRTFVARLREHGVDPGSIHSERFDFR